MDLLKKLDSCIKRMDQEEISLKEYIENFSVKSITGVEEKTGVDRLIYNHAMNKTQIAKICGVSTPTFNLYEKKLQSEGLIGECFIQAKSKMYSRFDIQQFMNTFEVEKFSQNYNPITTAIINHKGGVGKSTTARTMATGLALDPTVNGRILLIDVDPQGSNGFQGQQKNNDIYLTMTDILLRDADEQNKSDNKNGSPFYTYMRKYNLTPEEVVLYATIPTHHPNLDIISAFPDDERFTDYYFSLSKEEKYNLLREFKNFVMPILKSEYDIIFIDTPPQDSPITWSVLLATDLIITPIVPKQLDYLSTRNFIKFTRDRIVQLGVDNIKEWKILPVNVDENSKQQSQLIDRLVRTFTDMLTNNRIDASELFYAADGIQRTIYDIQKQECLDNKYASKLAYENALISANSVKRELIQIIKKLSVKEI